MDNLNVRAEIEVVVEGLDRAVAQFERLYESTGNKQFDKYGRSVARVAGTIRGDLGTAASTTAGAVGNLSDKVSSTAKATDNAAGSLPRLRYALYDVATTAGVTATAIVGVGTAATLAFANMESAFANVERTLDTADPARVEQLRQELVALTREMPRSFGDITEIATLGNQLGIASQDIEKFTTTVAQFSTATGISVQETALVFGQLGNLLGVTADDFDRLGSSIALVGVNSAATESQIVSIAREIAPAARAAGFTAEQVIGLSGALGSIRVPPERSRSTILQFFETLNMATAEGGDKLRNFAAVVGVTVGELEQMVRSGQGEGILRRFIGNISSSDTIEITQALDALGLAGLRTNPTIRALANNTALLNQTMSDSKRGWAENTELARQYGIHLETLASKWQIFINGVMEAGAAVGAVLAPVLGVALDVATKLLNGLSEFVQTPFGRSLTIVATVLGAIAAGMAGLIAALALGRASMAALQTAMIELGISSAYASGGLRGVVAAMLGIQGSAGRAAGSVGLLNGALRILRGILASLGIGLAISLIFDFGGTMQWLREPIHFVIDLLFAFRDAIISAAHTLSTFISMLPGAGIFKEFTKGLSSLKEEYAKTTKQVHGMWDDFVDSVKPAEQAQDDFNDSLGDFTDYGLGAADIMDDFGDSAAGAAQEVRTLVDYANDLSGVFKRAFDIRFGPQQGLDTITTGWSTIAKNIAAAREEMAQYRIELGQLAADRAIKQYWLMVAENYGDTLRAQKLRAELAELDGKQADIQKKLNAAQAKTNKTLSGNSDAAVENRAEILGLVTNYQNYLQALAASGASQEELQRESARLRAEFVQQATRMGYNRTEVEKYAVAFDDMRIAIQNVPRNITVSADTRPAFQALNEFLAQAAAKKATVDIGGMFKNTGYSDGSRYGEEWRKGFRAYINKGGGIQFIDQRGGRVASVQAFADGGYTGRGGKYDVAGLVHKGEYVVPKKYVNQRTGLPYASAFNALTRGPAGQTGYAGGGFVQPPRVINAGTGRIESFGPMAYQQLQAALRQIITVDGRVVAQTSSNEFARSTAQGAY